MKSRFVLVILAFLFLAACATGPGYYGGRGYGGGGYSQGSYGPSGGSAYGGCRECGVVERIERVYGGGQTSGGGAVLGAVVGGVLGNTVGKGDGRRAATVVGAVAGGVAGNAIERNNAGGGREHFEVFVRMDSGERIITRQYGIGGLREGSPVVIRDNAAFPR